MLQIPSNSNERKSQKDRAARITASLLDSPELHDLSDEQLRYLAKSVIIDELKAKLRNDVTKKRLNTTDLKTRWLNKFTSAPTKRTFETHIRIFLTWLGNISILDVDAKIVDDYLIYLQKAVVQIPGKAKRRISVNTLRLRVAACSSFWRSLKRWEIVAQNPWLGADLPKKQIAVKKAESVPSDRHLDKIEAQCRSAFKANGRGSLNRRMGARKALAAIRVLRATGLRVGALPSLAIDPDGFYTAKSKGGTAQGRIDTKTRRILSECGMNAGQPFKNYFSFSKYFERICKASDWRYTVHGIRHRFAVNHYTANKDPVALQRLLGHSSLIATQAYLATLQKFGSSAAPTAAA